MTSQDFWKLVGEGIAISFGRAPKFESRFETDSWIVSAGFPEVDFNCALVANQPEAADKMRKAVTYFRGRGVPFLICTVGNQGSQSFAAAEAKLQDAGQLPLMVFNGNLPEPVRQPANFVFRVAASPLDYLSISHLAEKCFGIAAESTQAVMPVKDPPSDQLHTVIALNGKEVIGSIAFTDHGNAFGIWSLMCHPRFRRNGIGAYLTQQAFKEIRQRSDAPVFLVSTPDGKPLYDRLGFQTIDTGRVWVGSATW